MGYIKPEYRDSGNTAAFLAGGQQWAASNKTAFTFMGTYPGFRKMMGRVLPDMFTNVAYIPYQDINLRIPSLQRNFEGIREGMVLMGSKIIKD